MRVCVCVFTACIDPFKRDSLVHSASDAAAPASESALLPLIASLASSSIRSTKYSTDLTLAYRSLYLCIRDAVINYEWMIVKYAVRSKIAYRRCEISTTSQLHVINKRKW